MCRHISAVIQLKAVILPHHFIQVSQYCLFDTYSSLGIFGNFVSLLQLVPDTTSVKVDIPN